MRSNYPLAWATDGHHTRRRSITPTVKKCGCIAARIFAPNSKKITLIVHDYANSVLFGSPITVLQLLQRVQNSLVRVVLQADRSASSTALLQQIHWLSVEKTLTSNWLPSPTKPWPLDLQLICLLYSRPTILSVLFVPRISCFSSGFLQKLILVHVLFVLLLLFGTHYLILSRLFLLYLPLNELSKITISGLPFTHTATSRLHRVSDSILDTGAL